MGQRIPESFIQELSARTDLVGLIHARVPLKKKGSQFWACCPFHEEKTPSFSVDSHKNFYHCFGCGAHGDGLRFLMDFHQYSFVESVEALADYNNMTVPYEQVSPPQQALLQRQQLRHQQGLNCLHAAALWFQEQLAQAPQALDYLHKRGITSASIQQFMLGYAPGQNRLLQALQKDYPLDLMEEVGLINRNEQGEYYDCFRQRLMFPIHNAKGQVIAFGARALDHSLPKYLNSSETPWFNKRAELYGLHQSMQQRMARERLLVVEGYMDVISLHQYGLPYAVAALGTALGESHIQQLKKRSACIYFALDGDAAGYKAATRALEALLQQQTQTQWRFLFLPENEDPDSYLQHYGQAAFEALLQEALTPSQFLIRLLDDGLGSKRHAEAKMQLLHQLQQWLALLPQEALPYRRLLQQEISQHFDLEGTVMPAAPASRRQTRPKKMQDGQRERKEHLLISILAAQPECIKRLKLWHYPHDLVHHFPLFWRLWRYLHHGEQSQQCLKDFIDAEQLNETVKQHWRMLEALPREAWLQTMLHTLDDQSKRLRRHFQEKT